MSFMTPRGLKIRIEIPYAFALMARLAPKRSAFRVLKTVEGLEQIPPIFGFIAAFYVLLTSPAIFLLIYSIVIGRVIGTLIIWFGLFIIPGLTQIATIVSYLSGYGILLTISVVTSFLIIGWQGVLALIGGWLISMLASGIIQWTIGWVRSKQIGQPITQSEINFFNAYRLHADACGVTPDLVLSQEEEQSGKWLACLEEYASNYPQAVSRFADSYYQAITGARRAH